MYFGHEVIQIALLFYLAYPQHIHYIFHYEVMDVLVQLVKSHLLKLLTWAFHFSLLLIIHLCKIMLDLKMFDKLYSVGNFH